MRVVYADTALDQNLETGGSSNQSSGAANPADSSQPQTPFQKETMEQAPSFQAKKWTGKQGAYETNVQYDYVGGGSQNLGNGQNEDIDESYVDIRHEVMRHTLLAFLVQGGVEYQHMGFGAPHDSLVPNRLDSLVGDIAIDFRWSTKDLIHFEGDPGLYTDFEGADLRSFNTPFNIGYTRVVSNNFQWVAGFSLNTWRSSRFLGAGGFRWQINDRWKIKAYLPTPDIEYYARPDLTLTLGADVRGDSYRVGPHFGDAINHPSLDNALVDYQEVRVGPGFSWNVRPLIEINFMAGYMVGRQYNFHNNDGPTLNGSGAPFVSIAVHALFKLPGEPLVIPQRTNISIHNIFSYL
jgi:hypothetical protein